MHHAHVAEDGQGVAYVALSHGIRDDNQLGGIGVGCRFIPTCVGQMLQSDSRMSDIAFTVGYSEPHYFSYLFKKHVGMTPRDYRARKDEVKV